MKNKIINIIEFLFYNKFCEKENEIKKENKTLCPVFDLNKPILKSKLIKELRRRGAKNACSSCNEIKSTILDVYLKNNSYDNKSIVPTFCIICNNCSHISEYALGGYIDLKEFLG